jgi:hypothetical protein
VNILIAAAHFDHHLNLIIPSAFAEAAPVGLEVVDFSVDESRSSFSIEERIDPDTGRKQPVVNFRQIMNSLFSAATCDDFDPEAPIKAALPVWRELLNKRGHGGAEKITDYRSYKRLMQNGGPDSFRELAPTRLELLELSRTDSAKFDAIMHWLVQCVGLGDPVIIWTLKNNSAEPVIVNAVEYDVMDVGQVLSGSSQAIEPISRAYP